jgi:nitrogen fixation protein NifU and related proteins
LTLEQTMSGLEDLYREIILDHYRNPRNKSVQETPPAHRTQGMNPLCGDEIDVYLVLDGTGPSAVVKSVSFGGQGCSISQSSASMMSSAVKGKTVTEARAIVRAFKSLMGIEPQSEADDSSEEKDPAPEVKLGDLEALRGVVKFPVRIKCATLAWNTMSQGFDELTSEG